MFDYQINRFVQELTVFAHSLDSTQWAVISVAVCVAGYMLLKGNNLRGG